MSTPGAVGPARSQAEDTLGPGHRAKSGWLLRMRTMARRDTLGFLAPAVIYLAIRLLGVVVVVALCMVHHKPLAMALGAWDGQWYLQLAAHGYDGVDPGMMDGYGHRDHNTSLAFFPGYPALVRLVAVIPGVGVLGAAIVVSLIMGVLTVYGLIRLGRRIDPTGRLDLLLVVLFATQPMSVVLTMPYTEATFCALAVWGLIGVLERKWLLAGACCAAAGLVRLTAAALIAVVLVAAVLAVVRRQDSWRPWSAVLLAPLGMVLYLAWVAIRTGRPDGYFLVQQRGWSSTFDGGSGTLHFAAETLATNASVLETITVWIVLLALMLLVLCVRDRLPWPLIAFTSLVLLQDLGSDGVMYSKVRLMLPAFALLFPLATGLAKQRADTRTCIVVLVGCFGAWFGAYTLTAWQYAI